MPAFTTIVPGRLWQVEDLLTAEQVSHIQSVDWNTLAWNQSPQQAGWLRREIVWNEPEIQPITPWLNAGLDQVNEATGSAFTVAGGTFWVDQPGFQCPLHTDGHLANSLQMYWIVADDSYGTGFYYHKRTDSLLYQFASKPNTGYLMLNHANPDGSQPLQWHAMLHPVPPNTIRVTSYWQFQ